LWALGCVVYQMLAGKPPFRGASEYLTFQKILKRELEFPEDFPQLAKDLINKLLVLEPEKRLGAETYEDLMKHKFFEGIDWDHLFEQTPPPLPPPSDSDDVGALPDKVGFDKDAKTLGPPGSKSAPTSPSGPSREEVDSDEEEFTSPTKPKDFKISEPSTPQLIARSVEDKTWSQFCMEGENLVFNGLVKKGRGLFTKKRQLMLTDFPRFFYVDPTTKKQKGDIQWSSELWAEFKDEKNFIIYTPRRKYYISPLTCGAKAWVDEINKMKQLKGSK